MIMQFWAQAYTYKTLFCTVWYMPILTTLSDDVVEGVINEAFDKMGKVAYIILVH